MRGRSRAAGESGSRFAGGCETLWARLFEPGPRVSLLCLSYLAAAITAMSEPFVIVTLNVGRTPVGVGPGVGLEPVSVT